MSDKKKKSDEKKTSEARPSKVILARRLARQNAIIDAIDMPIHIVDPELRVLLVNDAMKKWLMGLNIDFKTIIGKSIREIFPNLPADVENEYNQVLETRKGLTIDAGTILYENNVRTVRVQLVPLIDDGRVTHIITALQDITDHVRAQEELRAQEENYRMLVENVPASIVVVDHLGTILFINNFSAAKWGKDPAAMVGKNMHDMFPLEYAERQMRNIRKVIAEDTVFTEETNSEVAGDERWYSIIVQPYRDRAGKTVAALVIAVDISEKRDTARALRQSENRFHAQFEYIPVPTYIWECRDGIFYLSAHNKAAVDYTEGSIYRVAGLDAESVHGDRPDIIKDLYCCLREKRQFKKEVLYTFRTTGKKVYVETHYVYIPENTVLVHTVDITERKRNEKRLLESKDELEKRVKERTRELAEINEALQFDREALHQKNLTLRDVLEQIENGKQELTFQMTANIQKIIMPIINSLESRVTPAGKHYLELLRDSLKDIASPLITRLDQHAGNLTPRELEICQMVRNGMTCKDIAKTLNSSVQTVLKQRSIIRRKLDISNKKQNLATFLKSFK